jgi:membrane-associated phospholipid phosphatase
MKKMPVSVWIALVAVLSALVVTLIAHSWLWSTGGVVALQSLGGWLRAPMRVFTFLGDEQFYLIIIPLVYWCIHKGLGADLGVLLVLSSFTNGLLKSGIKNNRPFWIDPALQLGSATSFSTPSGHAQTSAALFGAVAAHLSRRGLPVLWGIVFGTVIALVALSRVYLGVHFPGDVMWGIAVGLALVTIYGWAKPRLLPHLKRLPIGLHVLLGCAAAAVIVGAESGLLAIQTGGGQRFPTLYLQAWSSTLDEAATVAGLALGLWVGLAVESRYVRFSVSGPWWQRVLRYLIGAAVLLAIWMGLGAVFPREPLAPALILRIVRYGLAMLWGILLWPWLFVKIGLGQREAAAAAGEELPASGLNPAP